MGKSVQVAPGFNYVEGPSPKGPRTYNSGATIVYTDAEYSALPNSITRCLTAPTTVADPSRPAVDPGSTPVNIVNPASGNVALALGVNRLLATGNVTVSFPTGVSNGNASFVELYLTQDGTGSRTLTLPAAAKAAGGTAPVASTGANKVDYFKWASTDGGATWNLVNKQLDLR